MSQRDGRIGHHDPFIGQTLQGFKVEKLIGEGGMGRVYLATQLRLKRPVALKILPSALVDKNDAFVERFMREAMSAAQITHPNIVQVHDAGEVEGVFYIAMELVDGQGLDDIMKERKILPPAQAIEIVMQAARGLEAARLKNLVHRDIKPANLMITRDGHVKVADFGLAKNTQATAVLTDVGQILGTPAFMSPEQGKGLAADHRSDLYSLGVTLFGMTTGTLPFEGETPVSIVLKHISEPTPDPRERNPQLSDGLAEVILKAMAKDPADRYQDGSAFIADLEALDEADSDVGLPVPATGISRKHSITPKTGEPGTLSWDPQPAATRGPDEDLEKTIDTYVEEEEPGGRRGPILLVVAVVLLLTAAGVLLALRPWEKKPGPAPGPASPALAFEVVEPAPGAYLASPEVLVKVRVTAGELSSLSVMGQAVEGKDGAYSATVRLSEEGRQRIAVEAVDGAGASHGAAVDVVLDTRRPVVDVVYPRWTRKEKVTVEGSVLEKNVKTVLVGETEVRLAEDGSFQHEVYLQEGDNGLAVTCDDLAGNRGRKEVVIRRDTVAPTIKVSLFQAEKELFPSPGGGTWFVQTDNPEVQVVLEPSESVTGTVTLRGESSAPKPLEGGPFPWKLAPGKNELEVKFADPAGNRGVATVTLTFLPLPSGLSPAGEPRRYRWRRDGAVMIPVPASHCFLGAPEVGGEGAVEIEVERFYVDRDEVTVERYARFLDALQRAPGQRIYSHEEEPANHDHRPPGWPGMAKGDRTLPVRGVSWFGAWAYARWAHKSLPTEAQWEVAASWQMFKGRPYPWGEDAPSRDRANFGKARPGPVPVGDLQAGRSHWGCFHMAGNVSEWCLDPFEGTYPAPGPDGILRNPVRKGAGATGWRALRGGSWLDRPAFLMTGKRRGCPPAPEIRSILRGVGFRCVLNPK